MDSAAEPTRAQHLLSCALTILTCAYVAATAIAAGRQAAVFGTLFTDLGADVGPATDAALAACRPVVLGPLALVVVAALLGKELALRSVVTRSLVSAFVFMAWACFVQVLVQALNEPMLALVRAIG